MSHNLNSLKGIIEGIVYGTTLDYSSCRVWSRTLINCQKNEKEMNKDLEHEVGNALLWGLRVVM